MWSTLPYNVVGDTARVYRAICCKNLRTDTRCIRTLWTHFLIGHFIWPKTVRSPHISFIADSDHTADLLPAGDETNFVNPRCVFAGTRGNSRRLIDLRVVLDTYLTIFIASFTSVDAALVNKTSKYVFKCPVGCKNPRRRPAALKLLIRRERANPNNDLIKIFNLGRVVGEMVYEFFHTKI